MKLTLPVLLASTMAFCAPGAITAWRCGPSYRAARPTVFIESPASMMLREQRALMKQVFKSSRRSSSPRYEIIDDEEKFQLAVDVPGVKMEDINVSLEDDGSILVVSGQREATDSKYNFASKFLQRFSIDTSVDIDKFTATLKNGVLIVTAPKDFKRLEANVRKIDITKDENGIDDEVDVATVATSATALTPPAVDAASDVTVESTKEEKAKTETNVSGTVESKKDEKAKTDKNESDLEISDDEQV